MIGSIENKWLRRLTLCLAGMVAYPIFLVCAMGKGIAEEMPEVHQTYKDVWVRSDSEIEAEERKNGYSGEAED